jgi:hypothetical protein
MRITEILTESQLEQLEEGPLGTIGSAIGKGVGGLAKGVGAVAGGIAGIGRAAKKGYEVGKATVAGDPVPDQPAPDSRVAPTAQPRTAPAAAQAPTAAAPTAPVPAPATAPSATDINKAGPANTVSAKPVQGAVAKQAMAKTAQALSGQTPDQAGQTLYAQVKSQINQLDKKGKQRLLQLLQKSISAPAPAAKPATKPAAAPAAGPGSATAPAGPGGAPRIEPELNAPTAAGKKKAAPRKPAAPSQAEIDADRQRLMGPGSESVIKKYPALSETLATRIDQHKRKMFEVGIASGEISVFAK